MSRSLHKLGLCSIVLIAALLCMPFELQTQGLDKSFHPESRVWSGNTTGITNQAINCVSVKPQSDGLIVLVGCRTNGNLPTLWRTFNGGATWTPVRQFSDNPAAIESITFYQGDPQTILVHVLDASSVWRSRDGGATWVRRIQTQENTQRSHTPIATRDTMYIVWEPTQHISNSPLPEAAPRLQVSANNVFLMWATPSAAYSFFARSSDNGIAWSAPAILPDSASAPENRYYSSNKFAVSNTYVYFMTQQRTAGTGPESYHLWFRRWAIGDPSWGNGRVLVDSVTPSILSSSGNDIVISHYSAPQFSGPYFASSSDSGNNWTRFSPGLPYGQSPGAMSLVAEHLYITRVGAVFGRSEVKVSSSTDHGATWRPEQFLSSLDTVISDEPHVTADERGNVFVVWRDGKYGSTTGFGGSIILRRSTDYGQTWLSEQVLTSIPSGLAPVVTVENERLAVVWEDEVPGIPERVHFRASFDRGLNWTPEWSIAPNAADNVDPDVHLDNGQVHVAWAADLPPNSLDIFYRVGMIVSTGVQARDVMNEDDVWLSENFPNPFNGQTQLQFSVSTRSRVTLEVYDVLGKVVAVLVEGVIEAGDYSASWNAGNASSGIYIARLYTQTAVLQRKLLLLK
jgi:hypothetical protein